MARHDGAADRRLGGRVTRPARRGRGAVTVVKIGGRLCEDPALRARVAVACARHEGPIVVVHGGGDAVTRLQGALGCVPRFVEGRRVTGEADLEAVEMVLSGAINKALVRALAAAGRPAIGLSGCDAGLIRCEPCEGLGRVGRPVMAEAGVIRIALRAGLTPVISPVSLGLDGGAVNVNADEVASCLAVALGARELMLLSDVEGVRVEGAWRRSVIAGDCEALIAAGECTRGMIPKLRAAAAAVAAGVPRVRIGALAEDRLDRRSGTVVRMGRGSSRAPATAPEGEGAHA